MARYAGDDPSGSPDSPSPGDLPGGDERWPAPAPPTVRDPAPGLAPDQDQDQASAPATDAARAQPGDDAPEPDAPSTVLDDLVPPARAAARSAPGSQGAPGGQAAPTSRVNLPAALTGRYVLERELGGGGEADAMLARDRADGSPVVVRRYRRDAVDLDPELMARLREAAADSHLIGLLDWGRDETATWEILEYAPFGSLHDLYRTDPIPWSGWRVRLIVEQIGAALIELHAMDVVHRDVKPQNILVRSVAPLDVALTDFGLARVMAATREMRTASRTSAYAAPEAALGATSRDLDWWSLGIVVVELLSGRNPFQRPDGGWFHDMQILAELTSRDIPLDGVTDDRWRRLCRGLLTRDPRHRWRGEQVLAWLDGQNPPVAASPDDAGTSTAGSASGDRDTGRRHDDGWHDDGWDDDGWHDEPAAGRGRARARARPRGSGGPGASAGAGTGRAYVFADVPYREPRALAAAMRTRWEEAEAIIGGPAGNPRLAGLRDWLQERGADAAARIVERDAPPARRLLQLILALDPAAPPVFRGQVLSTAALTDLLGGVAAGGPDAGSLSTRIEAYYDTGALSIVDGLAGCAGLAVVDDRWHRLVAAMESAVPGEGRAEIPGELWRLAGARLLAVALIPAAAGDLLAEADRLGRDERARSRPWFRSLARAAGDARRAAAGGDTVAADRATAIAMAVVLSAEVAATQASREAAEVARGGSLREQRRRAARRARVDSMSPVLSLLCALGAFVPLAGWAFIVGAYYFWFRTLRSGTASGCLRHAGAMLAALGVLAQLFWAS